MATLPVQLPTQQVEAFCLRNHIRKLSLFGSVLTPGFRPESDVDILVEFEPSHVPGYFGLAGMEIELSNIGGRKVDLRTPQELSRYFVTPLSPLPQCSMSNNADRERLRHMQGWLRLCMPHASTLAKKFFGDDNPLGRQLVS